MTDRFSRFFVAALLASIVTCAPAAQEPAHRETGRSAIATQFAWSAKALVIAPAAGPGVIDFGSAALAVPGGPPHEPWRVGVPVRIIDGAATETVVLTSSTCAVGGPSHCQATADFRRPHSGRLTVASGTDGLQEAIDFLEPRGGTVVLTPKWSGPRRLVADAGGSSAVQIEDERRSGEVWYSWTGGAYLPAAQINGPKGVLTAADIDGVRYADQFPGADIGAQVNAAIRALPGGCGTVVTPGGTYADATTIAKPRCVILRGQGAGTGASGATGGTVLRWTPREGVALAVGDAAGPAAYPTGGVADLTLLGPGETTATYGLWLGGDPADAGLPPADFAESQGIRGVRITGFGTGVEWGNNAWAERFYHDEIFANGVGVNGAPGAANTAEENDFVADNIFNNLGAAIASDEDFHFVSTSFDFNGAPSVGAEYTDCHFEQGSGLFIKSPGATIIGGLAFLDSVSGKDNAMFEASGRSPGEWHISGLYVGSNHPVNEVLDWQLPPESKLFISDLEGNGGQEIRAPVSPNFTWAYGSYVNAMLYGSWADPAYVGGTVKSGGAIVNNFDSAGGFNIELEDSAAPDGNPKKFLRVSGRNGTLQILNSAFTEPILGLSDDGALSWGGAPPIRSSAQTGTGDIVLARSPELTGVPRLPAAYTVGGSRISQPSATGTLALTNQLPLAAVSGVVGGAPLAPGQCASRAVAVPGARTSAAVVVTPVSYPGNGTYWEGFVSSPGAVTIKVCAAVAATPAPSAFQVRVLP